MTMTPTTTQTIVRQHVGRRSRITRDEMRAILQALTDAGLDLRSSYVHGTIDRHASSDTQPPQSAGAAETWAKSCRDLTCISVDSRGRLRDGYVRYDQPGTMHPMQQAELTFAPMTIYPPATLDYLRDRADRVLLVRQDPGAGAPACGHGHPRLARGTDRDDPGHGAFRVQSDRDVDELAR